MGKNDAAGMECVHTWSMTAAERATMKQWVDAWQRAAPELERVRAADIRAADTVSSIAAFRGLAVAMVQTHPPAANSGLVEQQRWFRLLAQGA